MFSGDISKKVFFIRVGGGDSALEQELQVELYEKMVLIRRFEEKTGQMYQKSKISGFCHLYIGEEAVGIGAIAALRETDYVVTGYREHGQAVSKGVDPKQVMAELFGKEAGISKGKGGSMHIFDREKRFLGGDAIVGGNLPIAVGIGLAVNYRKTDEIVLCFFGDGAVNEGAFHEAFNLAALWNLPVLFFCENNKYGMGTPVEHASSIEDLAKRAACYGMDWQIIDGMDVIEVYEATKKAAERVRSRKRPEMIEAKTYRFRGHSVADPEVYRDKEEVELWKTRDPIDRMRSKLKGEGTLDDEKIRRIDEKVENIVNEAIEFAEKAEFPPASSVCEHVYAGKF
ncbi:MAG: pyruvate dehydrogenase (acetyl-transferring) E1 component subunit alpha [Candidatus Hydrogenedentota bacterium]|nr:MAG: pyruvate dehydrogenase (acetyl-transferring) E1 component subunit alpha [Candidatus Hydrogenedentota bacterium]